MPGNAGDPGASDISNPQSVLDMCGARAYNEGVTTYAEYLAQFRSLEAKTPQERFAKDYLADAESPRSPSAGDLAIYLCKRRADPSTRDVAFILHDAWLRSGRCVTPAVAGAYRWGGRVLA